VQSTDATQTLPAKLHLERNMPEYILPPDLGDVYDEISKDVVSLHATWNVYRYLYASQESVALLNDLAPFAGRTIQDALFDAVLLQITRLGDPAESRGGKDQNLTLERLINNLPTDASSELISNLKDTLTQIRDSTNPLRDHRDKRVAHTDLEHAKASWAELPGLSRKTIENALKQIRNFMNTINLNYSNRPTLYENPHVQGGGDAMVRAFKLAARLLDLQKQARHPDANPDKILEAVKRSRECLIG